MDPRADAAKVFVADLRRRVDDLRRLPAGRWRGRREAVREVVQRWADLGADLEGEPRRAVPRLDGDPPLADQLAVVGDDLARAATDAPGGADVLRAASADLERLGA
ncbi:MAG: hypothetical protein M3P95_11045 [Actinomycetota bacterium]|nr:hypothetical protein [Actinomycetota bacterium]